MKRFLIAICILFPLLATAQRDFQIKSTRGDVFLVRANEKTWKKAKTLTYVALDDILNVKRGCSVTLIEKSTGREFYSTDTGNVSVKARLVNAERNARSTFSELNRTLIESVKGQRMNTFPYIPNTRYAATNRLGIHDTTVVPDLYDSIYASVLQFNQNKSDVESSDIIVKKKRSFAGGFSIKIKNNTGRLYYFNVVHVTDGHPAICYYFDEMDFIPLQSGATVDLTSFPLIQDQGQYILIASEINLSVELLEATFEGVPILSSGKVESLKLKRL